MEEREEEEDRLTGAIKTRMLLPTELIQLTTFMLNNSNVMEEWRNFYENAKSMSGRSRIFPTFHKYMKEKLAEVDQLLAQGESIACFPEITDDVRTIVHGPLRVVTTRSAMWTQGRHFRISSLDEKRGRTFDCGVQGQFIQDSRSSRHDRNIVRDIVPHYGKLEEILVVSYDAHSKFEEYVFKCKWFKVNLAGANCTQTSEPFTFPSHVEQCFYLPYPPNPEEWSLVVTYVPRSRSILGEKPEVVFTTSEVDDDHQPVLGTYLTRFKLHLAGRDAGYSSAPDLPPGFTAND
ncbi:unnamed protein product, partial [Sphagnum compactum]